MPAPLDLTFAVLRGHGGRDACEVGIAALEEPDPELQGRAAALLLELGDPEGFSALRRRLPLLTDPARDALRKADTPIIQDCWEALRKGDEGERLLALECLATVGRGEAVTAIADAMADPVESLRVRAAQALVDLSRAEVESPDRGGGVSDPESSRRRLLIEALLVALRNYRQHNQPSVLEALLLLDPSSHKLLLDILANPGDARRGDLLERIQHTEQPEVVPFLIKMSRDLRERLRDEGGRLLETRRQDPAFHKALIRFFERAPAKYLQRLASECESIPWWPSDVAACPTPLHLHFLGFLREAQKLPLQDRIAKLRSLLGLPDAGVRAQTALLLTELKDPEAREALWTVLEDPDETVQATAVRALAASDHPQRHRILTGKLNHPFPAVTAIAREAVSRQGFQHFLASFSKMDPGTRATAGQALSKLDPDLVRRVRTELDAPDSHRRFLALQILDSLGRSGELLEKVGELARDPDRKIRATAARVLGGAGSLESLQLLVRALADADPRVRANAIEALGKAGDPRLGKLLLPFLRQEDNRCRANAICALWNLGHPEAAQHLEGMLDSPLERTRLSGLWAASKVSWPQGRARLDFLARKDPSLRIRTRAAKLLSPEVAP